jgi:menaquinone-dependent protoporphyrinogen oxidase
MSTPRVLVSYGTRYGQTAKIAARIAELLSANGCDVTLIDGNELSASISPDAFDAVILGSSIIVGRHARAVQRFAKLHRGALNAMPSAFFSVSASIASRDESTRAQARRIRDDFLRDVGWRPSLTACFAGAIAYTRYSFLVRLMLRRIARAEGASTDTTRDLELTDWGQVDAFAAEFGSLLSTNAPLTARRSLSTVN